MKGGITSGVVYPLAAVKLATTHRYRFRNIGGTSAGAIAAAAVAAAEYGWRNGGNPEAYERIAKLPNELGRKLTSLFQPAPRMRPLFRILLTVIGKEWPHKVVAPLVGFPLSAAAGALPGIGLIAIAVLLDGDPLLRAATGLIGALALLLGPFLAAIGSAAWRLGELPGNRFGLCSGNDRDRKAMSPPLTRWLAELIDELAGKDDGKPLTFGDLWGLEEPDGERGVTLMTMTTNLSQGRPYSLPFEAGERFWFDEDEFLDLFPKSVVDHMVENAQGEVAPGGRCLHGFPASEDLPIVVAARMSLSFPGLIAAVPLYALNDAPKDPSDDPERCWFSDGGITSNFPVHFFDAPIPRWPTFAIDLMPLAPGRRLEEDECENVWLPEANDEGVADAWVGWEDKPSFKRLMAFSASIFRTAQNWIDNRQMRGAGYRDRIAHVRLAEGEGGMNLEMDPGTIELLARRGACAADLLAQRFGPAPPAGTQLSWRNQRWLRYRAYMELLERKGREAVRGYGEPADAPAPEPNAGQAGLPWDTTEQATFAATATAAQLALFEEWTARPDGFGDGAPEPRAEPWSIPRV
jgi:predicted acylesterase/phospholipase RssA